MHSYEYEVTRDKDETEVAKKYLFGITTSSNMMGLQKILTMKQFNADQQTN